MERICFFEFPLFCSNLSVKDLQKKSIASEKAMLW